MARIVDAALEATVVGSFSRVGYQVPAGWRSGRPRPDPRARRAHRARHRRHRGSAWPSPPPWRSRAPRSDSWPGTGDRAENARAQIEAAASGDADVVYDLADMADLDALRAFADRFEAANPRLDVLVHNAGALTREWRQAPDGTELTLAVHVLAPFLLTARLLPLLAQSRARPVLTMSSGGMYNQRLDLDQLEMDEAGLRRHGRLRPGQARPAGAQPGVGPPCRSRRGWCSTPCTRAGWTRPAWSRGCPPSTG